MTKTKTRRNQIATEEAVRRVCDELYRAGEKITEATVRAGVGGGSTTTILQLIREWEAHQRTVFLDLEALVTQYSEGDVPPGVPEPLWAAIKPVWGQVLAEAQAYAESRLADDRAALATDRNGLVMELERVRELDARWQEEKQTWADRIANLNGEVDKLKGRVTELAQDLIRAGQEATSRDATIEGLRQQLERAEGALTAAQGEHQASTALWAQQIDNARQEAKNKDSAAAGRIRGLEEQLAAAQGGLADLRIEHERTKIEANAARSADSRSQEEIHRLRADLIEARTALKTTIPATPIKQSKRKTK